MNSDRWNEILETITYQLAAHLADRLWGVLGHFYSDHSAFGREGSGKWHSE